MLKARLERIVIALPALGLLLVLALPILFRRLALVAALAHIVDPIVRWVS